MTTSASSELEQSALLLAELAQAGVFLLAPVRSARLPAAPALDYRSEEMRSILATMCKRGGFAGAVVADRLGLPIADFNSPVEIDLMAAFGSVLGEALKQAVELLQQPGANNISLQINNDDKIVLRSFELGGQPFFLLLVCRQTVDERSEVELSIEQLIKVLSREA